MTLKQKKLWLIKVIAEDLISSFENPKKESVLGICGMLHFSIKKTQAYQSYLRSNEIWFSVELGDWQKARRELVDLIAALRPQKRNRHFKLWLETGYYLPLTKRQLERRLIMLAMLHAWVLAGEEFNETPSHLARIYAV